MNIKSRVERLTDRLPDSGVCACAPGEMRVRFPGEPIDETPPGVCESCGRPREVTRLRVVYADEVRS